MAHAVPDAGQVAPSRTRSLTPVRTEVVGEVLHRQMSVENLRMPARGAFLHQVDSASRLPAFGSGPGDDAQVLAQTASLSPTAGPGSPDELAQTSETMPPPAGEVRLPSPERRNGVPTEDSKQLPMVVTEEQAELTENAVLTIGGQVCQITEPLGVGSFGVVWAAECSGFGQVAVKEIVCQSETDFSRAMYEAELLWRLTQPSGDELLDAESRIPAFVSAEVATITPEMYRVRLAMARIPGIPLDKFLRKEQQVLEAMGDSQPVEAELAQLEKACVHARAIVTQLAPTMERVATFAYHRDVNAHNILIAQGESESVSGPAPKFGLVDFGLAVDAFRWQGGPVPPSPQVPSGVLPGEREWEHLDVGGDCRYWPASAWLQFEVGCYEMAKERALCSEYQTHLDFQGLGITALQVLADMMPGPTPSGPSRPATPQRRRGGSKEDALLGACANLKVAWHQYWVTSSHYWSSLLDTFRNNGDWNALKTEFITIGVHERIASRLRAVRRSLCEALDVCRQHQLSHIPFLQDFAELLSSLLVMVSSGEERSCPCSWQDVLQALQSRHCNSRSSLPKAEVVGEAAEKPQQSAADPGRENAEACANSPDLPSVIQARSSGTPPRRIRQGSRKSLGSAPSSPEVVDAASQQQPPRAPLLRTRGCRDGQSSPSRGAEAQKPRTSTASHSPPTQTGSQLSSPPRKRNSEAARPLSVQRGVQAGPGGRHGTDRNPRHTRTPPASRPRQQASKRFVDKDSKTLLEQLNVFAGKVVHLAKRMEDLEIQDKSNGLGLAAAARERFDAMALNTSSAPMAQAAN